MIRPFYKQNVKTQNSRKLKWKTLNMGKNIMDLENIQTDFKALELIVPYHIWVLLSFECTMCVKLSVNACICYFCLTLMKEKEMKEKLMYPTQFIRSQKRKTIPKTLWWRSQERKKEYLKKELSKKKQLWFYNGDKVEDVEEEGGAKG